MSTGHIRGNMQERTMELIPTTATAADKLKRKAKTLRKTTQTSLAAALDAVARQHGYAHWKHVTVCVEQSASLVYSATLPGMLKDYLDRVTARHPASEQTQQAFGRGFVFAMDVKDAQDLALTADYAECDDGWHLAARDLWPGLVHARGDETGTTLLETQAPDDLTRTVLDDLQNYRFFRYLGVATPASLEEAFQRTAAMSFAPPTHFWLGGKFIDLSAVPEIRVDGQVIFASSSGRAKAVPSGKRSRVERFGHLLNDEERSLFGKMPEHEKDFWLFQLEKQTPIGKARYQPVHAAVTSSWRDAKKI